MEILRSMRSVLLAYSGGVDSTFLLKALGLAGVRVLAVTASSAIMPSEEVRTAMQRARLVEADHRIIRLDVLLNDDFVKNTPDRCFICKSMLFEELATIAGTERYEYILDGSTASDATEFRPGRKATRRYGVRSPLEDAAMTKEEIRSLSRDLGLATWNEPSSPCLATRIPYGQRITEEALRRVERAEQYLRSLGFADVRVRDHASIARIEVRKDDIHRFLDSEKRATISAMLKSFGYVFVSVDLDGYEAGRMDRLIAKSP